MGITKITASMTFDGDWQPADEEEARLALSEGMDDSADVTYERDDA